MQIQDIFAKDINRSINGVVKVDQEDEFVTWQELEEYVITRELDQHLRTFFQALTNAVDNAHDPNIASQMGVWISGFFGSGKSHFLKILSYLLENRQVRNPDSDEEKKAINFFQDKIQDPMLYAEMKRMADFDNQVILFNIDSRADPSEGRGAILSVLWKVFNEMQGFCPDYPYIAEIEKRLADKGCFWDFCSAFQEIVGLDWVQERDAFDLYEDEVVQALSRVLDKSTDKASQWIQTLRNEFSITVEGFAKRVKEYLDSFQENKGIYFLLDEVGQFIGTDTKLMLNLQTITEDLGRICGGRAWIVVTSQEDVDSIIGDLPSSQANDFSKIQGRFKTRLTLSSANTDEVIQKRLLSKQEQAVPELESIFDEKGDILKSQLSFSSDNPSLKNYTAEENFVINYPFAPFHFEILQKVFESIRKVGATGKHLAMGERSMLDAFQSAAQSVEKRELGTLVPLYAFYTSIESFLDTAVKRSVDQAWDNPGLKPDFDVRLLQVLFLIRYVDIVRPNVENLVTLSIDEVDKDRLALKKEIQASLQRLEGQSLINRTGDHYFFLTNEEREVDREIKSTDLVPGEESHLIGDIIFNDILKEKNKHRFQPNQRDYAFQRICDGKVFGGKGEFDLDIEVLTPLNEEYSRYNQTKCIIHTSEHPGRLFIVLPNRQNYITEARIFKQTDKYIRNKSDTTGTSTFKRILRDKQEENQRRRERLVNLLDEILPESDFYALGNSFEPDASNSRNIIEQGLEYLIKNTYTKFNYLEKLTSEPLREIKYILTADDLAQGKLIKDGQELNSSALNEVREFIRLKAGSNQPVIVNELKEHFAGKPYGWPEWEVILIVSRMCRAGEIDLIMDGARKAPGDMLTPLTQTRNWKNIKVHLRKKVAENQLKQVKDTAKGLFGEIPPDEQEKLYKFLRSWFNTWRQKLDSFKLLADTGKYPGGEEIADSLSELNNLLNIQDSYEFISYLNKNKKQFLDLSEDIQELEDFYNNQRSTWENLRNSLEYFWPNRNVLAKYEQADKAMKNMQNILESKRPYGELKDAQKYISEVEEVNNSILKQEKNAAYEQIDQNIQELKQILDNHDLDNEIRNKCLYQIQQIKRRVQDETSIPDIHYMLSQIPDYYEQALEIIEKQINPVTDPGPKPEKRIRQISLANLGTKSVLETESEVNEYTEKIRNTLLEAIKQNEKVHLK